MRTFLVVGPDRTYKEVLLDDGSGPTYPYNDVYYIQAKTSSKARWKAFKLATRNKDPWYTDLSGEHPLSGVTVIDATNEPDATPDDWPEHLRTLCDT